MSLEVYIRRYPEELLWQHDRRKRIDDVPAWNDSFFLSRESGDCNC